MNYAVNNFITLLVDPLPYLKTLEDKTASVIIFTVQYFFISRLEVTLEELPLRAFHSQMY